MKKKLLVTLTLALSLGLLLTLAIAYAQGPDREPSEEEAGGDLEEMGLADPPLAGFSVQYMFTGVANDSDGNDQIATAVHCTNYGSSVVSIKVEFFTSGANGVPTVFTRPPEDLARNETLTFSTGETVFTELPITSGDIEQGSGRVLATASTIICTAHLTSVSLFSNPITTTFMGTLDMYDSSGNLVGGVGKRVFLPVILKQ